jgi:putative heme-binding domain-containing protein
VPHTLELLAAAVADDHPQVRLEAVRLLGQIHTFRAAALAARALDRPTDQFLDYALWLTLRELQSAWLPALQNGEFDFNGNLRHLTFALQAVNSREGVLPLVKLYRSGKIPKDREDGVLALICDLGGPQEQSLVLDVAARETTPAASKANLLEHLAHSARQRKIKPAGDLAAVEVLLKNDNESVRCAATRLAGLWQMENLRPRLNDFACLKGTPEPVRRAALDGLIALGGPASRDTLEELSGADYLPVVRRLAVMALASLDVNAAAARAVDLLSTATSNEDAAEIFTAFLEQKGGTTGLVAALMDHKLPEDAAKIGVRIARESGRDVNLLIDALTKAGGLENKKRTLTAEEMKQFVADVAKLGDPARGEVVFRRKDQICLKCHAIGGAGGQVGPDLSSIGGSAQVDYLVESLLLPNKAIKEGYHSVTVTTAKGKVITGIKVRQTERELILRTGEDREIGIPLNQIEEQRPGGSLMPDGLTDPLTRAELVDLVRFLAELGKIGPYQVGKARVVRRWQVLEATDEARRQLLRDPSAAATDAPWQVWSPAYSTVAGLLPSDAVPRLDVSSSAKKGVGFVRFQVEVTTSGKVRFLLKSIEGLKVWMDGAAVEVKPEWDLDLPKGAHTLSFAVPLGKADETLRCELEDVAGSPARARLVGGK